MKIRPRGSFVLIRIIDMGKTPEGTIAIPQQSIEGKIFEVEAIGPKVEKDIKPGDRVLMIGKFGVDYYPLPNSNNLLIIEESHVVLVFEE